MVQKSKRKFSKKIIGYPQADSFTDPYQHQTERMQELTVDATMMPLYIELKRIRKLLEQLVAKK